jgi:hypothetical protein
MCWFADDFSRFAPVIADCISQRILYPPTIQAKAPDQVYGLYGLINALCERCTGVYSALFAERLPTLIESSLRRGEERISEKLKKLIDHWENEHFFSESLIDRLKQIYKDSAKIAVAPILAIEPEPKVHYYEVEDSRIPVIANREDMVGEIESRLDEDRRLYRGWMRNAVDWETPLGSDRELLVDSDDESSRKGRERICYVQVTPENEHARCSSCSGTFETVLGPDGDLCYKGVVYVKGSRPAVYMHQRCQNDELMNPLRK